MNRNIKRQKDDFLKRVPAAPQAIKQMHILVIVFICIWQFATLKMLNISLWEMLLEIVISILMINLFSFKAVMVIWKYDDVNISHNTLRFLCGIFLATIISQGIQYLIMVNVFSYDHRYIDGLIWTFPWRFIIWLMVFSLITIFFANVHTLEKYEKKRETEIALRNKLKEAELEFLKSQINPHFLFNSLNSLSSLIVLEPEKANEMVIKISDYLRYTLRNEEEFRRFKDELNNIDRYLEISKVRFGSKLQYSTEVSQESLSTKIPFMILQPLIENAIKYGIALSTEPTKLTIKADVVNNILEIKVTNNYVEIPKPDEEGLGIGLKNIRERLKLYFGNDNLLITENDGNKFVVKVLIPQQKGK